MGGMGKRSLPVRGLRFTAPLHFTGQLRDPCAPVRRFAMPCGARTHAIRRRPNHTSSGGSGGAPSIARRTCRGRHTIEHLTIPSPWRLNQATADWIVVQVVNRMPRRLGVVDVPIIAAP